MTTTLIVVGYILVAVIAFHVGRACRNPRRQDCGDDLPYDDD